MYRMAQVYHVLLLPAIWNYISLQESSGFYQLPCLFFVIFWHLIVQAHHRISLAVLLGALVESFPLGYDSPLLGYDSLPLSSPFPLLLGLFAPLTSLSSQTQLLHPVPCSSCQSPQKHPLLGQRRKISEVRISLITTAFT